VTPLLLIGGGGHCKAAIDVIELDGRFSIAGIVERPGFAHQTVLGYPVLGFDADLPALLKHYPAALVCIGQILSPEPRRRAFDAVVEGAAEVVSIWSPRSHVSRHARIGAGTLVMHGAMVNAAASIGRNCILNSMSLIEHDARVGDHCHVSTGARINGEVTVEDGCFIGSGAVLINGVTIGAGSIVGAGCMVSHNLPPNSFLKRGSEGGDQ